MPKTKDGGFKLDDSTLEPYKAKKEKDKDRSKEQKSSKVNKGK